MRRIPVKNFKFAAFGLMMSAAAISVLVQCAPKNDKYSEKDGKKEKTAAAPMTAGINFSALEGKEEAKKASPYAKEVLALVKEGKTPEGITLMKALVELHSKTQTDTSKITEIRENASARIARLVEDTKPAKLEELKKIYAAIEEKNARKLKYNPDSISLLDILDKEKTEGQEYSATSLLAAAWLSSSLNRAKAVIVIEDGLIRLGEIREKSVVSLDCVTRTQAIKEEVALGNIVGMEKGSIVDFAKSGGMRIIKLEHFVIHEILKSFAADPKLWSLAVQKASYAALEIKIDEKSLTTNTSIDVKLLNNSALLIGTPRKGPSAEFEGESAAPVTPVAGGSNTGSGTGNGGSTNTGTGGTAGTGTSTATTDAKSKMLQIKGKCQTLENGRKDIEANKSDKSLMAMLKVIFKIREDGIIDNMSESPGSLAIMARPDNLNMKEVKDKDADLDKLIGEARNKSMDPKLNIKNIVAVFGELSKPYAVVLEYSKDKGEYLNQFGNTLELKPAALQYLLEKSKATDDFVLSVISKTKDQCK
jgi:hypothetical protein